MNAIATTTGLALLCIAGVVTAQEPQTTLPAVEASAIRHTFDCDDRSLPKQADVAEWTGQRNFAQVYASRARLMGEVARACKGDGIEQVNLVLERRQMPGDRQQWVAHVEPRAR